RRKCCMSLLATNSGRIPLRHDRLGLDALGIAWRHVNGHPVSRLRLLGRLSQEPNIESTLRISSCCYSRGCCRHRLARLQGIGMNDITAGRDLLFRPIVVLVASLSGAAAYAGYMLPSPHISYVVPIVVPFVAFLFDRAERYSKLNKLHLFID